MAALDHGALNQEVMNLKEGHGQLRQDFRNLEGKVDSGFAMLMQKLDSRGKVDWTPVGILVTALLAIGGALYWPIRETMAKQEAAIEIMRSEGEARVVKLWDETNKTERELSYLQGQLHPLPPR